MPAKFISEVIEIRFASEKPEVLYLYQQEKPILKLKPVNLVENASPRHLPIFTLMEEKNV